MNIQHHLYMLRQEIYEILHREDYTMSQKIHERLFLLNEIAFWEEWDA